MNDAVVIGAGVAGLTAATRIAEAGGRVLVVAKGIGATHLAPGTIDVLGRVDGEPVERPLEALGRLGAGHPYARLPAGTLAAAAEWWRGRFADGPLAPYAYTGTVEASLPLPSPVGAVRRSALVPETMAAGDLRRGEPLCIVGLRPLRDFHAPYAADNLARQGYEARAKVLDLAPEPRADVNSLGYARAFDDAAFRDRVVAELRGRLAPGESAGFPAVLGLRRPHAAWDDLERRLARRVFEIPTLPPSVPGMRVFATLRERLRRAGARVILNATVTGAERAGDRVTGVRVKVAAREVVHRGDWIVLATGGFASGGLELDSTWVAREVALGLPVHGVPGRGEARFAPGYLDEQPMARAGIQVDDGLRPLGPDGARAAENVLVAGALLAGAEPWREGSGDGISLGTGFHAGGIIVGARTEAADMTNTSGSIEAIERSGARGAGA